MNLLDFQFVAILNLFVLLLWPATGTYSGTRTSVLNMIMYILTALAVLLDIIFLVLKAVH